MAFRCLEKMLRSGLAMSAFPLCRSPCQMHYVVLDLAHRRNGQVKLKLDDLLQVKPAKGLLAAIRASDGNAGARNEDVGEVLVLQLRGRRHRGHITEKHNHHTL